MEKTVCFVIKDKEIYLDKVLVELNFPILFVCKDDEGTYYMAMCVDAYRLTYLVRECTPESISDMIMGESTMREFWLDEGKYWRIYTGMEIGEDKVVRIDEGKIDESELPEPNKKYIIDDNEIREYAAALNSSELKFWRTFSAGYCVRKSMEETTMTDFKREMSASADSGDTQFREIMCLSGVRGRRTDEEWTGFQNTSNVFPAA